ncbi:hypothetical protein AOLI_G00211690 [Acnodon oligacanthus]
MSCASSNKAAMNSSKKPYRTNSVQHQRADGVRDAVGRDPTLADSATVKVEVEEQRLPEEGKGCGAPGHQREKMHSSQVQSSPTYYTWAEGLISAEDTHIAVSWSHPESAETAGRKKDDHNIVVFNCTKLPAGLGDLRGVEKQSNFKGISDLNIMVSSRTSVSVTESHSHQGSHSSSPKTS